MILRDKPCLGAIEEGDTGDRRCGSEFCILCWRFKPRCSLKWEVRRRKRGHRGLLQSRL